MTRKTPQRERIEIELLVIVGPTAAGKTKLATAVAQALSGEIISADSMQIYRGMDIGSAKPTAEERRAVVHHLIDFADPALDFSVAEYQGRARAAIRDIARRGALPILVGGTGLYVNAVLYDMDFSAPPRGRDFRERLLREAAEEDAARLHARLCAVNPEAAARIHPNNVKRVVRALEISESAGALRPFSASFLAPWREIRPLIVRLTRERAELYARIEQRVDAFFSAGLIHEVKTLAARGLSESHIAMKGIGYKEILGYLRGEYDLARAVELVKQNSRRYAKRQNTWFKRYEDARVINLSAYADETDACADISEAWRRFCADNARTRARKEGL
ncbi:MAG: tRNA (adenosine(37)-N6)-dimethylallyltransferase MiaA [Clostridiales Family XIII bacterium]|jgi:tRNA dimethylallyltransferase|nr:tRNA (adenosine(37)-N6)-dimethylallyltransferase MiaA [Clostridiales Family XIII bacterium]